MPNWNLLGAMTVPNIGGWGVALAAVDESKDPDGKDWYERLRRPPWNPPDWLVGTAWTALYSSMGYASYMIYEECGGFKEKAVVPLSLYAGQLVINWTWTPVFFKMHKISLALAHILALDVAATACAVSFYRVNPDTALFMSPYLCWLAFATCLTHSLWDLNKDDKDDKEE